MAITTNGKVPIGNIEGGTSSDIAALISDESGTGVLAFTTSPSLTSPTLSSPVVSGLTLSDASIVIEGATADGFETTLTVTDPSADRTITFQDASGTVAYLADISAATGGSVTETGTQTLTNKTLTSPIIDGTGAVFEGATADGFETTLTVVDPTADRTITLPDSTGTVALTSDITVTDSSTTTLTNKTLTSPVLGGTTTTASGNLAVQPATYVLEVKGGGSTEGAVQLNCAVNSHGQLIKSQPHSENATNTLLLPGGTTIGNSNAVLVSDTGTQTITNKTLTSPLINTAIIKSPEERLTVSATAATGTVNYDTLTQGVLYYTTDASGNWTLNVRGDGSTTLNDSLATGDSITIVFLVTQGGTAYYSNAFTIDGNSVTPKYITGTAFSAGNASSIDSYVYTIIKTGSATFTVLASQTKFA